MCPDDCVIGKSVIPVLKVCATYSDVDLVETGKSCRVDVVTRGDSVCLSDVSL